MTINEIRVIMSDEETRIMTELAEAWNARAIDAETKLEAWRERAIKLKEAGPATGPAS
jgi:hypothetical protein